MVDKWGNFAFRLLHNQRSPLRTNLRSAVRIFEQYGWRVTHSGKVCVAGKNALTVTKKNPGQSHSRGFYRLLPQLVGSFDPGGGVSGMGCCPDRAYQFKS